MKARITWQSHISGIQSRNNFVQVGSQIIFGSSGEDWNERDASDGVYSIDPDSGEVNWFVPSDIDVNEIALISGVLLAPTDNGELLFIDPKIGEVRSRVQLDSTAFGKAIPFAYKGQRFALLATITGTVFLINVRNGEPQVIAELNEPIRASLVLHGEEILAFSENGVILSIDSKNDWGVRMVCRVPVGYHGGPSSIAVAPLKLGNRLYVGYARETYYEDPPLFCLDLSAGEIAWQCKGQSEDGYGNLRSSPEVVGGLIAIAPAYSDSLTFVSPKSGRVVSDVKVGQSVFQQWSGPVKLSNRYVAIGRVDGVCSILDVQKKKLSSSISLATAETERSYDKKNGIPHGRDTYRLYPGEPAPEGGIVGTPLHTGSALFVGTTDGRITRIELSWIE